jgi:hypothetical protein
MSQGFICPRHSESTNKGMPPPPQHKDIEQPPGEPPRSWSIVPTMGDTSNLDSVEQHPAAKKRLPDQAKASTVEEQRSSRKRSTASQSSKTRAPTANSTQSTTSMRSSRKRSMASQSSKTRAPIAKCWVRRRYCLAGITKLGERVAKNTKLG